jgi:hypothetical protein
MVEYAEKLIGRREEARFGEPLLLLNRRSNRNSGPFHVLIKESIVAGTRSVDGRYVCEVKAPGVQRDNFYFGLVVRFGVTQAGDNMYANILDHVSLRVFQAYPTGDIFPLFRADWDWAVATDSYSVHAQPHWHFTQSACEIERVVRTLSSDPIDFGSDPIFDRMPPLDDAHFAMSHLGIGRSHKRDFDTAEEFIDWFKHLVLYIVSQLVHVCGGAPSPFVDFGR